MVLRTVTGTVTYTGFMEGTGTVIAKNIVDTCVPGIQRNSFWTRDTFESLTVAGKTGGAVVEAVGNLELIAQDSPLPNQETDYSAVPVN